MNYKKILEQEYLSVSRKPDIFHFGNEDIIIPESYKGNTKQFLADIFHNSIIPEAYKNYGNQQQFSPITNPEEIKAVRRAKRKYYSGIRKTWKVNHEYPDKKFKISFSPNNIKTLDDLHRKFCIQKLAEGLEKTFKWNKKHITNMLVGTTLAAPLAAYFLLNKKIKLTSDKNHRFIKKEVLPYVRKGIFKTLIPLSAIVAGKNINLQENNQVLPQKTISAQTSSPKVNSQELPINTTKADTTQNINNLTKKYKITDAESFKALYEASLPTIIESMLPTEILMTKPYSDNGITINTVGLGSYYFPKDGDPKSPDWELTSKYVKKHKLKKITGMQACNLTDGWFRYREYGRVYKALQKRLIGTELNVCEFAAIATCTYNEEANGFKLADYVKKNYNNPVKCAAFLCDLRPGGSQYDDGIKKRHAHEALLYLNVENYAEKLSQLIVKKGINSKGNEYHVTSVTYLKPEECLPMIKDLKSGKLNEAKKYANKIFKFACRDGVTVAKIMQDNGIPLSDELNNSITHAQSIKNEQAQKMYNQALSYYNQKDYQKAIKGFQSMIDAGYDGADIHNDLAIAYYNTKQYEKCISECRKVLATGETEQYAHANYNAGMAYEKMNNHKRALNNYNKAKQIEPENETYQTAVERVNKKLSVQNKIPNRQQKAIRNK